MSFLRTNYCKSLKLHLILSKIRINSMKIINILPPKEEFIMDSNAMKDFQNETIRTNNGIILLCTKGYAMLSINEHKYSLSNGMICVIFPYDLINISNTNEDFQVVSIITSEMFISEASHHLEKIHDFLHANRILSVRKKQEITIVKSMMKWMYKIYNDKESYVRRELFLINIRIFFLNIYDKGRRCMVPNGLQKSIDQNTRSGFLFHKYINLIFDQAQRMREVAFYANELCISPKYLNTICKDVIGKTAKEVIDNRVIMQLKIVLRNTDKTIQQISDEYNFPNQSYFGRYFRKIVGIPPSEFRKQESYS